MGASSGIPDRSRLPDTVDVRPFKELVLRLPNSHPGRILLLSEPDSISMDEFASKILGWLLMIKLRASGD